jgi:hypothetical protein
VSSKAYRRRCNATSTLRSKTASPPSPPSRPTSPGKGLLHATVQGLFTVFDVQNKAEIARGELIDLTLLFRFNDARLIGSFRAVGRDLFDGTPDLGLIVAAVVGVGRMIRTESPLSSEKFSLGELR